LKKYFFVSYDNKIALLISQIGRHAFADDSPQGSGLPRAGKLECMAGHFALMSWSLAGATALVFSFGAYMMDLSSGSIETGQCQHTQVVKLSWTNQALLAYRCVSLLAPLSTRWLF
jgi:hypothetical protein